MPWFQRKTKNIQETSPREMPDGLWTKCDRCGEIIYKKQLEEHAYTCPKCNYHFRIGTAQYVKLLFDDGTFVETDTHIRSADPLEFVDTKPYTERLRDAYRRFGPSDALTIGYGSIGGQRISFGCMNFTFIGGSMGSVVGEKFVRAVRRSLQERIPLVVISASGGARMQEAAFSLMQMAKTERCADGTLRCRVALHFRAHRSDHRRCECLLCDARRHHPRRARCSHRICWSACDRANNSQKAPRRISER